MGNRPIMIMAGGTGGHVYPALAVADYFRAKGVPLFWLGTAQGLEARVVPEQNIELLTIRIGGARGKGLLRLLLAPGAAFIAVLQALCLCLRRRPAAALGMGGFASGPGGIAAWLLRVPLLIHEQNRIPGTTNRILARFATKIMQGFPEAFSPGRQAVTTGNPVRQEIANLPAVKPRADGTPGALRVLVLGGSQGARKLNQIVPQGLKRLSRGTRLEARHQCGRGQDSETAERYRNLGLETVRVEPFITDMAAAYAWADVAICRAGALTIAELCAAGLASVLVPFPHAIDDHQTANARYLSERGGAALLPENELTAERLETLLADLATADKRGDMARKAKELARPGAAEAVGRFCLEAAHG